jgi:hypothetical protein
MPSPDRPGLHDYSHSRAVLIGTWEYEHLPAVPAAEHSLRRMQSLVGADLCGWPEDRVTVIPNRRRPGDLYDELIEAFSDTADDGVALFYYVGHGQPDDQDRLCLGLVGSRTEALRRSSTSLRFDDVRDALSGCPARTKIVILDCCFAGLAARSRATLSSGDVLDMTRGTGAYTMAASGAYMTAWFEAGEGIDRPLTYFTKYLADVVEAGIPGQPSGLTLDRIFARVQDNLVRDRKPAPTSTVRHEAGRFVFARNAAPVRDEAEQDEAAQIQRLRAELAAANEKLERSQAQERQNEQALRELPHDEEVPDDMVHNMDVTANAIAEASAQRLRITDALWQSAGSAGLPGVADLVQLLNEFRLPDTADADPEPAAAAQMSVAEVVEKVLELNGLKRVQDVHTVLRSAGLQRPLPEVADLVRALHEAGDAATTDRFPLSPRVSGGLKSRFDHIPMADLVLMGAAFRPVNDVVELLELVRDHDIGQVLSTVGWSSPVENVASLSHALRARNRDEDADMLLRQAGRRGAGLPELITLLNAEDRQEDIVSVLRGPARSPVEGSRQRRRELARALRRTNVSSRTWRPLLRKQNPIIPVWGLAISKLSAYGIAALLIGIGAGVGYRDQTYGLGNFIAFAVSTATVLLVATLVHRVTSSILWSNSHPVRAIDSSKLARRVDRDIALTRIRMDGGIPEKLLRNRWVMLVEACVFALGAFFASEGVAATTGAWFMWRF